MRVRLSGSGGLAEKRQGQPCPLLKAPCIGAAWQRGFFGRRQLTQKQFQCFRDVVRLTIQVKSVLPATASS